MNSESTRESAMMFSLNQDDMALKQPHDEFDVFVNGTHVGRKVLLNESDSVNDIAGYLRNQGFHDFSTNLTGDHYDVKVEDIRNEEDIRKHLQVYLDIR